jgi:hypothetical protein
MLYKAVDIVMAWQVWVIDEVCINTCHPVIKKHCNIIVNKKQFNKWAAGSYRSLL